MTPEGWIALAVFIFSVGGSAAYVGARIGRLEGKLNNGVFKTQDEIKANVRRLFEKWEDLPCERHGATLSVIEKMLEEKPKEGDS